MEITKHKSCGCHTERKLNVSPKEKKQAEALFAGLVLALIVYYFYQKSKEKPAINSAIVTNNLINSANLTMQEQTNLQANILQGLDERVRDLERCFSDNGSMDIVY